MSTASSESPDSTRATTRATTPETLEAPKPLELPNHIITSPYTSPGHQLDLATLGTEHALFARALQNLRVVRDDYATAGYVESFNWGEVMGRLRELVEEGGLTGGRESEGEGDAKGERNVEAAGGFKETTFFIVAFRSRVPPTTVYEDLGVLDEVAHAEAVACGGFLKYWFGTPDPTGRNLATCIWRARADALKAGRTPGHQKAARATAAMYAEWKIDRHRLVVGKGAREWNVVGWREEDEGRDWGL